MKKIIMVLGMVAIATLFSCQKKDDCWSCEQEILKGARQYHTIEYCGTFKGMREIEHKSGGLYTKYRCTSI